MSDYRAYIVGADGHFQSFEIIEARRMMLPRSRRLRHSSMAWTLRCGTSTERSPF
jgi:hypothetical protein